MRVYTSKLTPDSVVTYLFHDLSTLPVIVDTAYSVQARAYVVLR